TVAPSTPRIIETGISNGMIMVRPMISVRVITTMPTITTQGRFVLRLSPRNIETILGTTSPKNGSEHTTTDTTPVVTATIRMPVNTTARYLRPTEVAISSPRPAPVNRSALKSTHTDNAATIHRTS